MVTIAQVAAHAGVSVATVSRVLNGSDTVKPDTAKQVMHAIEELRYTPNLSARNLRRNESRVILVLAPNFSNPYYSRILAGIGDLSREKAYSVLICNTSGLTETAQSAMQMLSKHLADGAIMLGCPQSAEWVGEYVERYPVVLCCEYIPKLVDRCPIVSVDNYAAARQIVRYLRDLGHRRIAMIGAENAYASTQNRWEGYRDELKESGLACNPDWYEKADADYSFASGRQAALRLLSATPRPTAIFAISDILALSAISVAQELGLNVPRDLTVVGFDDVDYTTMFHPFLTSVRQPCYEMGQKSLSLLLSKIQGCCAPLSGIHHSSFELIERESSAPPIQME